MITNTTTRLENELTLQDREFIADCLGLSNETELENSKLKPYKKAFIEYCMFFKRKGLLTNANISVKEKLLFFINNYAINWLPNEEELNAA